MLSKARAASGYENGRAQKKSACTYTIVQAVPLSDTPYMTSQSQRQKPAVIMGRCGLNLQTFKVLFSSLKLHLWELKWKGKIQMNVKVASDGNIKVC